MAEPTTPAEWALYYYDLGWSVVPAWRCLPNGLCECGATKCDKPGKHPIPKWTGYQVERTTRTQVIQWWRQRPNANISAITGALSGFVVLDIDPRHDGDASLTALGPMPDTPTSLTGGGGQHFFFAHPGYAIKNGADLAPGIDFRGDGGQVIVPPSNHASGNPYCWEVGYQPGDMPLAPLPANVLALFTAHDDGDYSDPGERHLDPEDYISRGKRIPEGARNATLTRLVGLFLGQGHSETETFLMVNGINLMACDPGPIPETELRATVRSVAGAEARKRKAEARLNEDIPADIPDVDRRERVQAAFRLLGLDLGDCDIVKAISMDGVSMVLSLPDQEIDLGPTLLNYGLVRSKILNATNQLIRRMKMETWDPHALRLTALAREQRSGHLRTVDQVAEWLDDIVRMATDCPIERRAAMLWSTPIYYGNRIAIRTKTALRLVEAEYGITLTSFQLGRKLQASGWANRVIRVTKNPDKPPMRVWLSPVVRDYVESEDDEESAT